jgi:hypothetical protein
LDLIAELESDLTFEEGTFLFPKLGPHLEGLLLDNLVNLNDAIDDLGYDSLDLDEFINDLD